LTTPRHFCSVGGGRDGSRRVQQAGQRQAAQAVGAAAQKGSAVEAVRKIVIHGIHAISFSIHGDRFVQIQNDAADRSPGHSFGVRAIGALFGQELPQGIQFLRL
jgi:dihydrodipicolinate reductase